MTEPLLKVTDLKVFFDAPEGTVRAVDGIDFDIHPGETVALLGESGCGKSVTALSLLRLLPSPAGRVASGSVRLLGQELLHLPEREMRDWRGRRIAMIFQEPQTALNPVLTVGEQIREAFIPKGRSGSVVAGPSVGISSVDVASTARQIHARMVDLFRSVGISDPERRLDEYPHQLSGGMKQRVMIAMALASRPDLLVADEPTTALDVTIQAQILDLLKQLQKQTGMAILFITHDLGVVSSMADRVAVMYAGEIVELAPCKEFFSEPRHPYSKKLFQSMPSRLKRGFVLDVIQGSVPSLARQFSGCRFAERCDRAWTLCREHTPAWQGSLSAGVRCHLYDPSMSPPSMTPHPPTMQATHAGGSAKESLLRVRELKVHFPITRGVFRRVVGHVKAVDGVSFDIPRAHTLALVGESGCGKTTAGKAILQLLRPSAGSVNFDGQELTVLAPRALRPLRRQLQPIFQDPYGSLDPRMRVAEIIEEGLLAQDLVRSRADRADHVAELMEHVGLSRDGAHRYPHEFSGGQRARIAIARALAVEPRLVVCDEPTSALDVSVQAQILNLLRQLQDDMGLSYLFITHNLSVVEYLAHEVSVMYLGRIVEHGGIEEVLKKPRHPYTQALLAAVPRIGLSNVGVGGPLQGDIPSPSNPPSGCHFHPRCPQASAVCRERYPGVTTISPTHRVHCHLYRN